MFNQFVSIEKEVQDKLKWLGESFYYLFKDSSGKIRRGVLFELTESDFEKASVRLKGVMTGDIVSGDKVFVLPNCRIPLYKLKDYIKTIGAVMTSDVQLATKIIGHDKIIHSGSHQAPGTAMLFDQLGAQFQHRFGVPSWISDPATRDEREKKFKEITESYKDVFKYYSCAKTIVSPRVWPSEYDFGLNGRNTQHWFITPTAVWILYNHLVGKIPVLSENLIFEKIGKPVIIDRESYQSIHDMLNSEDEDNQMVGAELLANSDIDRSLFYIWKLSKDHCYTIRDLSRYKNVRLFIQMSHWDQLAQVTAELFAKVMLEKGVLTSEYFQELVPVILKSYTGMLRSNVFVLKLEPSEEYKQFAEPGVGYTIVDVNDNQTKEIEDDNDEV